MDRYIPNTKDIKGICGAILCNKNCQDCWIGENYTQVSKDVEKMFKKWQGYAESEAKNG